MAHMVLVARYKYPYCFMSEALKRLMVHDSQWRQTGCTKYPVGTSVMDALRQSADDFFQAKSPRWQEFVNDQELNDKEIVEYTANFKKQLYKDGKGNLIETDSLIVEYTMQLVEAKQEDEEGA